MYTIIVSNARSLYCVALRQYKNTLDYSINKRERPRTIRAHGTYTPEVQPDKLHTLQTICAFSIPCTTKTK